MKVLSIISLTSMLTLIPLMADESFQADLKKNINLNTKENKLSLKETLEKHAEASVETADGQDELSADVQDLIQEQANPKVIELLDEAESLMGEATELLEKKDTGSNTIAIQTEIIEKIYEAAKQKQQQPQPGQPQPGNSPMMEMMKGMMGEGQGEQPGESKGEGNGGEGQEGTSDQANDETSGSANNTKEERRVPKNTSAPNQNLPKEEQRALDAYNK